jgi:hypothetical protein
MIRARAGDTNLKVNHQLSQALSVDQNDSGVNVLDVCNRFG